jgi:hypothetical protein
LWWRHGAEYNFECLKFADRLPTIASRPKEHCKLNREVSGKSAAWGETVYLAFAAVPVSIYVLAMVILEQGGFGTAVAESKLAAIAHPSRHLRRLAGRSRHLKPW